MTDYEERGMRAKGEEALGDLAQALLDNPVFSQAVSRALGAGERAAQAQRNAMSAVGVPSAADVERLERRLRSLSGRLEEIEDRLDELTDEVAGLRSRDSAEEGGGRGATEIERP
jgi:predicted RNase H-like nuclease (RuvC/YqgF family)